jgi:hypothetical protein
MRTLLLAEAPFRDLVSRALLAEAVETVPHEAPLLVATRAARTPPGTLPVPPGEVPTGVTQVLLSGAFLDRATLEQALEMAGEAVARGARLLVHNLAVEASAGRGAAPHGAALLDRAAMVTVRDHRTANILTLWRVAAPVRILAYPERRIAPDMALAAALPAGPLLGLAFRGGDDIEKSWRARIPALRAILAPCEGWPVVPLPTLVPGSPGNDMDGTRNFAEALLPGARMLFPDFADVAAWRKTLTPARLKGLVSRCALVVTQRDLPACYAVAAGVRVYGISLGADRRIVSCLATLANDLPPGAALLHPSPD